MAGIAIEKILSQGNLNLPPNTYNSDSVLEHADALVNESDVVNKELGHIIFQDSDGKYYAVVPSTTVVEVDLTPEEVEKYERGNNED